MTKLKKNINLFFLIILLCSSAANIALFRSGYSFIPKSYVLFALCYAAFFGAMAFLSLSNKENAGKASRISAALMPTGGTYNAVVIRRDEGALGGGNTVIVRNVKRDKKLLSGTLESSYVTVRHGGFGDDCNISWADDETLVVNGAEEKV